MPLARLLTPRAKIVEAARSFIGAPYRHKGRNRFGIDCWGLVVLSGRKADVSYADSMDYPSRPTFKDTFRIVQCILTAVPMSNLAHGDVVAINAPAHANHLGIVEIDEYNIMWIIHACQRSKMVVRQQVDFRFAQKFNRVYSYTSILEVEQG